MSTTRPKENDSFVLKLERELEEINRDRGRLEEENKALTVRSEGVLVISEST